MSGLTTYDSQVSFAKRFIKSGEITEAGTWTHGRAWGKMWSGTVCSYRINFYTIGDGPYMKAGSFRAKCLTK